MLTTARRSPLTVGVTAAWVGREYIDGAFYLVGASTELSLRRRRRGRSISMTGNACERRLLSESDSEDSEDPDVPPEFYPCLREDREVSRSELRSALFELTPEGDKAKHAVANVLKRKHRKRRSPKRSSIPSSTSCGEKIRDSIRCCDCSKKACSRCLRRTFPFVNILNGYSALYDLPCDVIAGLTVGIMHIPQGMAYALLTQLPAVYGLYTSFFPVLVYFFFGTSKHISVGTFAVISLMVGSVVDKGQVTWQRQELKHAFNDLHTGHVTNLTDVSTSSAMAQPTNDNASLWLGVFRNQQLGDLEMIKVGYAMAVTLVVGILQVILGLFKLGFLTSFLSDPLISGFTTGAAIHVFSSQVKAAFGVKVKRYSGPLKLIFAYKSFFSNLNQLNPVTFTSTLAAILVLLGIREGINNNKTFKAKMKGIPVPGELLVIVVGTLLSHHFQLHEEFDVHVIGHIPKGFPTFSFHFVEYVPDVIGESFAICFTSCALSFAIAKILADKHNYAIDANQELVAHGVSNIFGSSLSSFCSSASLSRSMVQDSVGGKTQIVSLFSSVLVAVVLLALGPLFEKLPTSILAAIIIVSLKGLFLQFREVKRLWTISKVDCTIWLVTFLATVFLDVDLGLLIGLVYNLVPILLRTQGPYTCLLGNLPNTDVYVDTKVYRDATPVSGIKIFKFEAPLYFANMENFRKALIKETKIDPHYLKEVKKNIKDTDMTLRHHEVCMGTESGWLDEQCDGYKHNTNIIFKGKSVPSNSETFAIIIDGSAIQYIDSVTARILKEIVLEYREVDIDIYLGECKAPVRAMLEKSGFYDTIYRRNVCATIHHAVQVAQKSLTMSKESLTSCYTMTPDEFLDGKEFVVDLDSSDQSIDKIASVNVEER